MTETIERRTPEDIVATIHDLLKNDRDHALTVSRIAQTAEMNYNVVKKWIRLIGIIQSMPKIETVRLEKPTMIKMETGLLDRPRDERNREIKRYFPEVESKNMVLWQLLEKGATKPDKAIKVENTPGIDEFIHNKVLKQSKKGVYLTGYGILVAEGIRSIYG